MLGNKQRWNKIKSTSPLERRYRLHHGGFSCSPQNVLNSRVSPRVTASAPEGVPVPSPRWGCSSPRPSSPPAGAPHPRQLGQGSEQSLRDASKNRGAGCPFSPRVLVTVTLQCSPAHLEGICSHSKWPHRCGTSGRISRSAGQPQAEPCPQQLLQAGWGRTHTALFVLTCGWKQRAKGTSFPIWLPKPCYWQPGVSRTWKHCQG